MTDADALTIANGPGPTGNYHGRPGMGFLGTQALRFDGLAAAEARLHRVDVLKLDQLVAADSQLSYVVSYQLDDALTYAGGFVALDLRFDDGTRLSDLGPVDQLGFTLTPSGQGESKALYPNQWNFRSSALDAAVGRRAVAVELGWLPVDEEPVTGWLDRIRLETVVDKVSRRPVDHVVTTRGTQSNGRFSRGNNIPAAAWPNGFALFTPCTDARTLRWLYSWSDHNDDQNQPRLQALSVSHQPSPWMGDRLAFQLMPQLTSIAPTADPDRRGLAFDHDHELARPHHYRVELDAGIVAELAPTDHAVAVRTTFPTGHGRLVFDNATADGRCWMSAEGVLTGWSDSVPGARADGAGRMFVYGYADLEPTRSGTLVDGAGEWTGRFAEYGEPTAGESLVLTFWLATSYLSVEQARHNLGLEVGRPDSETSFDQIKDHAADAWDERLSVLEISGANVTPDALTTLYSNLYRLNLYPSSAHENTGTLDAPDWQHSSPGLALQRPHSGTETGCVVRPGRLYVNHGFWDTYRTAWPLYTLLYPAVTAELVDGFLQHYRDAGWIPRWSSPGFADCMVGTSSDVAFADALVKGAKIDVLTAYAAAVKNGSVASDDSRVGRKSIDRAVFLGYTPVEEPEGMSWSLDGYINDVGIAAMARWMLDHGDTADGHVSRGRLESDLAWFSARATDYVRLFHPGRGFFHGRKIDGEWRLGDDDTFDPDDWGDDYTETNAWNMAFTVPHDGAGLAALYGGRVGLADKLTEFFDRPERATNRGSYGSVIHEMTEARDVRMGMYGHSNQPAHHIAFMWLHALRPDRCQEVVREIMSRFHQGSEIGQGYGGDEDNGEMSAWQVFAALGIYPAAVGSPHYSIGSPLYGQVIVHRADRPDLLITAPDNAAEVIYVAGVSIDGVDHDRTWLGHDELQSASQLSFTMASQPQAWGCDEAAVPPSVTTQVTRPVPLVDVTDTARITATDGVDLAALSDNTSDTASLIPAGAQIRFALDREVDLELYTLTSARTGTAPDSWRLEGLVDDAWVILDERTEQFDWARQTRPFRPSTLARTRALRVTFETEEITALAQLELLAYAH